MTENQSEMTPKPNKPKTITIKNAVMELEELRESTVISFLTRSPAMITMNDVMLIVDNLDKVSPRTKGGQKRFKKLDLFLSSTGGSIDVAYKIVNVCRDYAEEFNVLVPFMAKSAATLICLGADEIVMLPVAELGPLDPIINHPSSGVPIPVRSIRDFLDLLSEGTATSTDMSTTLGPLRDKLDPWVLGSYETAIKISEYYAERLLSSYMLKNNPTKSKEVARILAREIPSHQYAISREEAKETYKLNITCPNADDDIAKAMKQLFIIYMRFMNQGQIVVLSGTRDVNTYVQKIAPSASGEPRSMV